MKKYFLALIMLGCVACIWAGNVQLQGVNADTGLPQSVNMNVNTSSNVRLPQCLYATSFSDLAAYTNVADGTDGYILGSGNKYVYNATTRVWNQLAGANATVTPTAIPTATPAYAVVTVIIPNQTPVAIANVNVTANAVLDISQLINSGAPVTGGMGITAVAGTGVTVTFTGSGATTWRGNLWF